MADGEAPRCGLEGPFEQAEAKAAPDACFHFHSTLRPTRQGANLLMQHGWRIWEPHVAFRRDVSLSRGTSRSDAGRPPGNRPVPRWLCLRWT